MKDLEIINKINLLLKKSHMAESRKKAWEESLPKMTAEQLSSLEAILQKENEQLQGVDSQYREKITRIKAGFNAQWQEIIKNSQEKINQTAKKSLELKESEELESLRKKLK